MTSASQMKIDIILIGNSNTGKSTLIDAFVKGDCPNPQIQATLGINYTNKLIDIDGKRVKVALWDPAGQQRYLSIPMSYIRKAQGAMLIFDLSSLASFEKIKTFWLNLIAQNAEKGCPMVLVGNKSDLPKREVSMEQIRDLTHQLGIRYIETSALQNYGVTQAFVTMTAMIMDLIRRRELKDRKESGFRIEGGENSLKEGPTSCIKAIRSLLTKGD